MSRNRTPRDNGKPATYPVTQCETVKLALAIFITLRVPHHAASVAHAALHVAHLQPTGVCLLLVWLLVGLVLLVVAPACRCLIIELVEVTGAASDRQRNHAARVGSRGVGRTTFGACSRTDRFIRAKDGQRVEACEVYFRILVRLQLLRVDLV